MMGVRALHLLWFLSAFSPTAQDLLVTPHITAECGEQVTLHCNASSSEHVRGMQWYIPNRRRMLCSVKDGKLHTQDTDSHHWHCGYRDGRLSLVFERTRSLQRKDSSYTCKLQSTRGVFYGNTTVEFKECHESKSKYRVKEIQHQTLTDGSDSDRVGSLRAMGTVLCMLVLLALK